LALQSLSIAKTSSPTNQLIIEAQPAYIFLTSWVFGLFGSTNFLARFWPALAGGYWRFCQCYSGARLVDLWP